MAGNTTPRTLFEAAETKWRALADDDRDRSVLYLSAEERIFTGQYLPRTTGTRRAQNWVLALHRYEEFWSMHARAPRENTRDRTSLPSEERRLGEWARYQRRFQDGLCLYQRIRFDVSPAFAWDPQQATWHSNWNRCLRLLERSGRLPYLNSTDRDEFALARWLGRQMHYYQKGTLSEERSSHLGELLQLAHSRQSG